MSESEMLDNVGQYVVNDIDQPHLQFSMVTLKYILMIVAILYLLVSIASKLVFGDTQRHAKRQRRRFLNSWNDETKKRILDLSKRTVDIKDFSKYKSSDIENITLLNTVINACISKLYTDLSNSMNMVHSTCAQPSVPETNEQEAKEGEDLTNQSETVAPNNNTSFAANEESKIDTPDEHNINLNINQTLNSMDELEQGSEVNLSNLEIIKHKELTSPIHSRRRSILKLKKNVSFNLMKNQIKIIV